MPKEKKYKVISFTTSTPPSDSERACTTTNSFTAKTSTEPGDYDFVSPDTEGNTLHLLRGKSDVRCKSYNPSTDDRNYCYNKFGAYRSIDIQDSSTWNIKDGTTQSSSEQVKLTEKYTVEGLKSSNVYVFEDCGLTPEDSELKLEYFEVECPDEDVIDNNTGDVQSSHCDEHLSKCCNIQPKKFYKYGRALPSIVYEMEFEFLVKIQPSYVWNCFSFSNNPACEKVYDKLFINDVENLKLGETKNMRRYVGRVSHIHWYLDVEITRTKYRKIRPTESRPKVDITALDTDGYTELPTETCPSCLSDYLFSIPTPGSANPTQQANRIINDLGSYQGWDRISSFPDGKLDEGGNAGKYLSQVSTGNDSILSSINIFLDSKTSEWREQMRSVPKDGTPNFQNEEKSFNLPRSLAYLKLKFEMNAALNPEKTNSCFGCSAKWRFSSNPAVFLGGPTP